MKDIDNKYKGLFINVSEKFSNFKTNLDRKAFHHKFIIMLICQILEINKHLHDDIPTKYSRNKKYQSDVRNSVNTLNIFRYSTTILRMTNKSLCM